MKRVWEGEAPAEPNLSANLEIGESAGREGNGQRMANSEWRMVFSGKAVLLHCRKISEYQKWLGGSGSCPTEPSKFSLSKTPSKFGAQKIRH